MAYFGIGIENVKTSYNVGTLWRSASALGAAFIYTIGTRYKRQSSDTSCAPAHIPLYHYDSFEQFYESIPYACQLVGVELDERSIQVAEFTHPTQAIYLLGAEDHGLSKQALSKCHELVQLPGNHCLNVAVAGSLVMYDRLSK